jgi:hypothetical protein
MFIRRIQFPNGMELTQLTYWLLILLVVYQACSSRLAEV